MPLTRSAADVTGLVTLVLVLLVFAAGALCAALALHFHSRAAYSAAEWRLLPLLADFDTPWAARLALLLLAVLWALNEVLRLPLLRKTGWPLADSSLQDDLCRFHTVFALGIAHPGFLLTILFLLAAAVDDNNCHRQPQQQRRNLNTQVLRRVLAFSLPVAAVHAIAMSVNSRATLPSVFTEAFAKQLADSSLDQQPITVCAYPLSNTLALATFDIAFVTAFACLGRKALRTVINRQLRRRVLTLLLTFTSLIPVHALMLGISASVPPTRPLHEILSFLGFLAMLLWIAAGGGLVVVAPILDALAVNSILEAKRAPQSAHSTPPSSIFIEPDIEASVFETSPATPWKALSSL